jgi:protein involved in polysaccharide export with SLBB domain
MIIERGARGTTFKMVARLRIWQKFLQSLVKGGTDMMSRLLEKRSLGGVAVLVIVLCTGCQSPVGTSLPEQPTAKTPVNLAPGDVVKLTFSGASELNQSQKIRADGKLSLPLVGEVTAAGKTVVNFQNELIALYKSQLRNSDVVVTLESGVAEVVVSGAVQKPAKLSFERPTTVFQAIMEAGGVNEYGNLRKVHLIRVVNGEQLTQVLDLKPALSGKSINALYVKDGDVIYVPQSVF